MSSTGRFSSLLALMFICEAYPAQSLAWNLIMPGASPQARGWHAMVYDSARQRVVMLGGYDGTTVLGDTWEWDGITWAQAPASISPPRQSHAMAYDSARQRVVLFGGAGYIADTWEWDGINWVQRTPSTSPVGRVRSTMTYDASRQRVVLYGGYGGAVGYLGDTWEWDGVNWTASFPSSAPSPRERTAMTYDEARQRVVLFGGDSSSGLMGDTWEWTGTNWLHLTPTSSPVARSSAQMTYDVVRQRVLLFGGGGMGGLMGDTWEWDGVTWMVSQPTSVPTPRATHAVAYDAARQRVVMFGGSTGFGYHNETWLLGPAGTLATATQYGAGCGAPSLGLVPDPSGRPLVGQTASATIDNSPTQLAWIAIGWSNQYFGPHPLPVTLSGIGMAGCYLLQSSDILGFSTTPVSVNTLRFDLAIPNTAGALGLHVYLQAYAIAPGANALHLVASNGIDWLFGDI